MEKFQTYPLSLQDNRLLVIDEKQSFPRFTSHDSGISFGDTDDESITSDDFDFEINQTYSSPSIELQPPSPPPVISITNDGKHSNSEHAVFSLYFI